MGLLSLLATTGCSSIIEGTSQEIAIETSPPGASCALYRQDGKIGEITPSPGTLLVRKSKYDIIVVCVKDGYQQAIRLDHSGTAATTVANLVLSAGIGWAMDSVSGADNKYDSPINVTLVPARAAGAALSDATSPPLPARLAGATPPD
jgi:hypothetical protein